MKNKRWLALALALSLTVSAAAGTRSAAAAAKSGNSKVSVTQVDTPDQNLALTREDGVSKDQLAPAPRPDEDVRVIIVMDADSVVEADRSAGYSAETARQMEDIKASQDQVIADIEENALDGDSLSVTYQYSYLVNGVAATVPYGKMADIEAVDGVRQVVLQTVYEPCVTQPGIAYPTTISDGVMICRESTWAKGYNGNGMKIAVIDTGLDMDHQNFAALPDSALTDASLTQDDVAGVLKDLNAYHRFQGLKADQLYRNTKVPFGYNYVDDSLDVTHDHDKKGDHGTHVSGIAAANKVAQSEVVGVAPNAQLLVMKVFGQKGGAYTQDWVAALEDAMLLGADVVNMSLGADAGFTTDADWVNQVFDRVADTGTVLCISAGNAYTAGYGNHFGTNANLTSNPDNAILGSPGAYANALSVASVDNVYTMSDYLTVGEDHKIAYTNGASGTNAPFNTLAGTPRQVVAVPGAGNAEDFSKVDVKGKIALVQRGVIAFTEKYDNAQKAGAVGCLIYNNQAGTITMDLSQSKSTIPCASLTMADGAYLLSALEGDANLTISVGADQTLIASDTAYQMSDFSSWGVTPSLTLEPDLTAPGGNIYSTTDKGTYGLMSGTSMAAPNLSGISALVKEYALSQDGLGKTDGANTNALVRALMMSTATPLVYQHQDGLYYSPRKQGAGLANAYASVTTQAYLSVDGSDVPKAQLGDDAAKSGAYRFDFHIHNFGDSTLFYDLNTVAQTEGVLEADGNTFMSGAPKALEAATAETTDALALTHDLDGSGACDTHDAYQLYRAAVAGAPQDQNWSDVAFRYNTNGDEATDAADVQAYLNALVGVDSPAHLDAQVMAVAPGADATVQVTVNLADADKTSLDTNYPNGGYVEGFTFLTARNAGGADLSLPYLGFYGDWTRAPIFDGDNQNPDTRGFFWGDKDNAFYSQYMSALWTQMGGKASQWIPGVNPFVEETFDLRHVSVSPNADGSCDYLDGMYVSLLRNAADLTATYTNADTGEEYFSHSTQHVPKSHFIPSENLCVPFVYAPTYQFTDAQGQPLPNNTKVALTISATLDYPGAQPQTKTVELTVDTAAPELVSAQASTGENGQRQLTLTFRDNLAVAGVTFVDNHTGKPLAQHGADDAQATRDEQGNLVWTQTYDVSQLGDHFTLVLGDYAMNLSQYAMDLTA